MRPFIAHLSTLPVAFLATLGTFAATDLPALAQSYPERAITLIVPFPPGGSASTAARGVADKMSETLWQPVVVDNRGGAGGTLAQLGVDDGRGPPTARDRGRRAAANDAGRLCRHHRPRGLDVVQSGADGGHQARMRKTKMSDTRKRPHAESKDES
jgi:hypothetical protein